MKFRTVIVPLIFGLFLIGCANNQNEQSQQNNDAMFEQTSDRNEMNENFTNEDIANHLADIAKGVPDVENAFAIVAGPYAVVGIDVDKSIDRQRVGTIKFSVSEALRDDPYGKTAVVVADADGTERIRKLAEKIRAGEPIQGFVDELAEIVARYMPTFPVEEPRNDNPVEDINEGPGENIDDEMNNNAPIDDVEDEINHDIEAPFKEE